MFHPLIPNLKDLSTEDLINKINELSTKMNQCYRFGKVQMANQIRYVMYSYQEEYQKRMAEAAEKAKTNKHLKDKVKTR